MMATFKGGPQGIQSFKLIMAVMFDLSPRGIILDMGAELTKLRTLQ